MAKKSRGTPQSTSATVKAKIAAWRRARAKASAVFDQHLEVHATGLDPRKERRLPSLVKAMEVEEKALNAALRAGAHLIDDVPEHPDNVAAAIMLGRLELVRVPRTTRAKRKRSR